MAKRAKIPVVEVEDDSPAAATGDTPAASLPDQPAAPRSSPQRSPQRKSGFWIFFCSSGALEVLTCTDILLLHLSCAEVEPQLQERPETTPEEP